MSGTGQSPFGADASGGTRWVVTLARPVKPGCRAATPSPATGQGRPASLDRNRRVQDVQVVTGHEAAHHLNGHAVGRAARARGGCSPWRSPARCSHAARPAGDRSSASSAITPRLSDSRRSTPRRSVPRARPGARASSRNGNAGDQPLADHACGTRVSRTNRARSCGGCPAGTMSSIHSTPSCGLDGAGASGSAMFQVPPAVPLDEQLDPGRLDSDRAASHRAWPRPAARSAGDR